MANFNINAFYKGFAGNTPWDVPARIVRGSQVPLDTTSLFKDKATAEAYAAGGETLLSVVCDGNTLIYNPATSYPGQFIAVANGDGVTGYLIGADRSLIELGSAASTGDVGEDLKNLSSYLLSADGIIDQLSGSIDKLSADLSTDLSGEIEARKSDDQYLSGEIDALSSGISADVKALSVALSTEISALEEAAHKELVDLSVALSTDLSAEIINRTQMVEKLSGDLSADIKSLSAALSTEISAETKAREEAIKALEDKLSSAWQFRGVKEAVPTDNSAYSNGDVIIVNKTYTDLDGSTKIAAIEYAFDGETWQQLGDESSGVSKFELKTAIDNLSATVSAEIDHDVEALSTSLSNTVDAEMLALSTALSTEISAETIRAKEAEESLKTDIDNKVFIDGVSADALSVQHISRDDYYGKIYDGTIDPNTLYVVSSDTLNMYDQKIINLQAGEDEKDGVNVGQLSSVSADLQQKIDDEAEDRAEAVAKLSADLSAEISSLSGAATEAVDDLSVALSTDLSAEIEARKANDAFLSSKVDGKIYAQLGDDAETLSVDTLTIHKISAQKYAELLETEGGIKDTDIYVVSSDYIDGYGERVKNIADGEEATDGASYGQVMALSAALSNDIGLSVTTLEKEIEDAVKGGVEKLSAELLSADGIIPTLDTKVNTLSANLSTDLSAEIEARKAADKEQNDALTQWKNDTGLSAAGTGEDNQVVLWKDVKHVTSAMHFRGKVDALSDITDPVAGDIVMVGTKEYVYGGTPATWAELGDESIYWTTANHKDWVSSVYDPFVEDITLSATTLSNDLSALSAEVQADKAALAAEVARATAAEEAVDGRVTELSTYTHAMKVTINEVEQTFEGGNAVFDISCINCGGANDF